MRCNLVVLAASVLTLVVSLQAKAESEYFGHWPTALVQEARVKGNFSVNSFSFTVTDWKIASFIRCAKLKYPNKEILIFGDEVPGSDNSGVVNAAYVCKGQINLSNCDEKDREWFCNL